MQLKPIFPGRPRRAVLVRSAIVLVIVILAVSAVLERDPRLGAAVVVIAAFSAKETVELSEPASKALGAVTLVAIVAWLALLFE